MRENDSETHKLNVKKTICRIACVATVFISSTVAFAHPGQNSEREETVGDREVFTVTTTNTTTTTTTVGLIVQLNETTKTTETTTTTTTTATSDVDIMASISTTQSSETTTKDTTTATTITTQYVSPNNASERPVIYDCPLADDIQQYIYDTCVAKGVEYELVMSIMFHESRFTPTATNGTCFGLMQIHRCNKEFAASLGVYDLYDPYGNALVGITMLANLRATYSMNDTILCYAHGTYGAKKYLGTTTSYSRKVINKYNEYVEYNS